MVCELNGVNISNYYKQFDLRVLLKILNFLNLYLGVTSFFGYGIAEQYNLAFYEAVILHLYIRGL